MDGCAERTVYDDPPVTDLVAEALDDQGLVIRHETGFFTLLAEVVQQVLGGVGVQAPLDQHRLSTRTRGVCHLADERSDRLAQLSRSSDGVALPERQAADLSRSWSDQHLVAGDVLDSPRGGA